MDVRNNYTNAKFPYTSLLLWYPNKLLLNKCGSLNTVNERGSLNKWRLIGRLWTENSFVSLHISMKGKIDQMNKVIQYGDERLVMNMVTGEIVGHVVTVEKKQSIVTVVVQKIVRMFTA